MTDTDRLNFALSQGSLYVWRKKTNGKGELFYEGDVIKDREELDRRIAEVNAEPNAYLKPKADA